MKQNKLRKFNTSLTYRLGRYIKNKATHSHNTYVKTLSTKALIITGVILGFLWSPIIPGGFTATPIVMKVMIR